MRTKAASVFSVDGFCNWKNAFEKFKKSMNNPKLIEMLLQLMWLQSTCQLANSYRLISSNPSKKERALSYKYLLCITCYAEA